MTTESGAPAGEIAAPADTSELSLSDVRAMIDAREFPEEIDKPAESAEPATAEQELAQANAAPEKDPGEDAPEAEPEENLPLIDPPRSWTKEEKEEFATYPREAQEKIARREQERETNFRRSQNEVAEQRKAVEAERKKTEEVKQQYEAQLPAVMQALHDVNARDYADIKSMADVNRIQAEITRLVGEGNIVQAQQYQAYLSGWQVHQQNMADTKAKLDDVQIRQAKEKQAKRAAYEDEQNRLLVDLVPEMADPKKANELRTRAVNMLTDDLGLKNDLLSRWMTDDTGHEILSNAGIQKLIADGLKYRDILSAPKAVAAKPVPQVQKPGIARTAGDTDSANIQVLEKRLNQTGSEKDAWALFEARQRSRRAS